MSISYKTVYIHSSAFEGRLLPSVITTVGRDMWMSDFFSDHYRDP